MRKAILAGGAAFLIAGAYVGLAIPDASWARSAKHKAPLRTKHAAVPRTCGVTGINSRASTPLSPWTEPSASSCAPHIINGYPVPDPRCTPGAVNPTLSLATLKNPGFTTTYCLRDAATSGSQKEHTYGWYGTPHPAHNSGMTQTCELDHLISLELGGADTLANIWPQCGPLDVERAKRFFHQKDKVENYLADKVRSGEIPLAEAQQGIARDWTQYLAAAVAYRNRGGAALRKHASDQ